MNRVRDFQHQLDGAGARVREQVRHYADESADTASDLIARGRQVASRLGHGRHSYGRRLSHLVEDMGDEASYQFRRARRHVSRHPLAATAIVAGTVGAFLLLRHLFRSDED